MHALQHRGQEGCGIVSFDGKKYHSEKRFGLVGDNFNKEKVLKSLPGNYSIGHNRYSTTGGTTLRNIQPFFADTNTGGIGVSHNGNLTNAITLRKKLVEDGAIFYTTSDTETIVQLIARSKRIKTLDKIFGFFFGFLRAYVISVCIFATIDIVYNHKKWPINLDHSYSFPYVLKGSNYLIKEFPNEKDYQNTKEKVQEL